MALLLAVWALSALPLASAHANAKVKARAAAAPKHAAMVIDANTGRVLHDDAGDEPRYPASLTKMMTLYMLFGEIEQGRLTYQSRIRISERAHAMAPSKLGLEVGEDIAVIDAIKALVVKSANDIAVAVAEHIGGTEYQFARMMTERAQQIGMRATAFRNASGLPNPGQMTTARDMLTLALRLHDDFPQHYRLFSLGAFEFGGKIYKSHNTLMRGFPGMDGIKTGYTRASGFNLVSSVRADGKHVVGAVFGGKTAATRNALMRSLLYTALQSASTTRTRDPQKPVLMARRAPKPAAEPPQEAATAAAPPKPAMRAAAASANVPLPVRAVRPARPDAPQPAAPPAASHDAIGEVLSAGSAAPQPEADEAMTIARLAEAEAAAPAPRLDLNALREAMTETTDEGSATAELEEAEPDAAETAQAAAAAAPSPRDIAGLIRNSLVEGAPAREARPASTLNAQASALGAADLARQLPETGKPSATALTVAAASPAAAAAGGKGFEIQIGAYTTPDEAQSKIEHVRNRAAALLDGHGGVTLPVQRADRQIFRARFVNFDERSASSTCLELRRLAIDCLVMRAE